MSEKLNLDTPTSISTTHVLRWPSGNAGECTKHVEGHQMHPNQNLNDLEHVFCIQDKHVRKKQNAMHVWRVSVHCKLSILSSFSFFVVMSSIAIHMFSVWDVTNLRLETTCFQKLHACPFSGLLLHCDYAPVLLLSYTMWKLKSPPIFAFFGLLVSTTGKKSTRLFGTSLLDMVQLQQVLMPASHRRNWLNPPTLQVAAPTAILHPNALR